MPTIHPKHFPALLVIFSGAALSFAYISQYGFDMQPCILCLYQRVPFFIVLGLGLIAWFKPGKFQQALVAISGITLLIGAAIAFYHVGVEQHWWVFEHGCGAQSIGDNSVETLRQQLLGSAPVPCDKPQFVFLGLSMAGWNVIASSIAGLMALCSICCKGCFKIGKTK